ncbi:MAG TPA: hypothetical protein VHO25_08515 [Polyangiaceae bacterium]|nr:hypothetical protein [Polyangiaceae bacterium]
MLLLVANDHWLKRAGELPGWFTGKASDFCALVVGPLCLLALMPRRGPTVRALCIAAFALPYAAINLSVSCSNAVQALAAGFGLRLRLWSDAIDLVALTILPVTWFFSGVLAKPDPQASPSRSRHSRFAGSLAERTLGFAGIVACIASGNDPTYNSWAYVINGTGQPLMVEYAETPDHSSSYSCEPHAPFVDNLLRYGDFTGRRARYRLAPGEFLPLPEHNYRCSPARITAAGVTLALASETSEGRTLPESPEADDWRDRTRLVSIVGDDIDGYHFNVGAGLYSFTLADDTAPLPVSNCPQLAQPRASMSGAHSIPNATLLEIRPIGPSCLTLVIGQTPSLPMTDEPDAGDPVATLGDAGDAGFATSADTGVPASFGDGGVPTDAEPSDATTDPPTLIAEGSVQEVYWCGPTEHFPFSVGQRISVSAGTVQSVNGSPFVRTVQSGILFNTNSIGFTPEVSECGLVREACGAIWQPLDVTWNNGVRLIPGERNRLPALGRDVVLLRAARLIIPNEACEPLYQNDEWFEWIDRELSP